jgi:putative ABC transport system ATP-binding protein
MNPRAAALNAASHPAAGNRPGPDEVIVARALTRQFPMGDTVIRALQGVDVTIRRGEYVAIMGPSGSGKSTLMNIIGCLDRPDSGEYWLNGTQVAELGDGALAALRNREIGFVFQTFNLLARADAVHNVELPLIYAGISRAERLARAREALEQVGLRERMNHRPSELSGGQRQRVAVARALVTRPSLLLADEPTGNLDSATTSEILGLFAQLHAKGNTIVLVTHEAEVAEHAGRCIRMLDGRIASDVLQTARPLPQGPLHKDPG